MRERENFINQERGMAEYLEWNKKHIQHIRSFLKNKRKIQSQNVEYAQKW